MSYIGKTLLNAITVPTKAEYSASVQNSTEPLQKPQSQPLHDQQVKNNAGGYGFKVTDMIYFQRFLFLGSEKGTYYVNEGKLTLDNIECIERLVRDGKGPDMLELMRRINAENRVAKSGPMHFALAYMAKMGDTPLRKSVYECLHEFLRIPTHLFEFLEYSKAISQKKKNSVGWGRLQRSFIQKWYSEKDVDNLTYQVTKYQQRNGWSHRDVFRLAHVIPKTDPRGDERSLLYTWIVKKEMGDLETGLANSKTANFLRAYGELAKMNAGDDNKAVEMITRYGFVREHIPTALLNSAPVWEALLENMPLGALIRNLNKMTKLGLFDGWNNDRLEKVISKLEDESILAKARIHPLKLIVAMLTYSKGRGDKGSLTWDPNQKIIDALNDAYYKSFKYATPTGKRFLIAVDVSSSMTWGSCAGANFTPREGSACLALTLMNMEKNCHVLGFSHTLVNLPISPKRRLDDNIRTIEKIPMGATDLSLPIRFALDHELEVDCFIVLSDNETWAGQYHPSECLRSYRKKMGIDARYVNVQMTATKFSVADPDDVHSLEIAGFDSGMLETISEFLSWEML